MNCAVIFREPPLDRVDELSAQVRQVYGVTDFDARMKLRRGWGFLERSVPRPEAERLVGLIDGCAIVENVREPGEPRAISGLQLTDDGIVPDGAGLILWSDILIVAVGAVTEETIRRESGSGSDVHTTKMMVGLGVFMLTGVPVGLGGGKKEEKKPVKSTRWVVFGRIVTRQGAQLALSMEHFNFAGLGAKKQLHAQANLRTLVDELRTRAAVRLNLGARLLLASQPLANANYGSVAEFETELRWLFNVA